MLTAIGVYWSRRSHSVFFAVLGLMLIVAGIPAILFKSLKQAMPRGVNRRPLVPGPDSFSRLGNGH